jgi:hypothetical protein
MAAVEGLTSKVICPLPPQGHRAALFVVPEAQRSSATPQHKDRTSDAASGLAIRHIMVMIERCRRSIFLADRMDTRGITQGLDIRGPHSWAERVRGRTPTAKRVINDSIGSG